jgi:ABC-type uncharacterized transport system substrate-binding protein
LVNHDPIRLRQAFRLNRTFSVAGICGEAGAMNLTTEASGARRASPRRASRFWRWPLPLAARAAILGLCAAVLLLAAPPAFAHPHVWVTARSEIIYNADARVAAVRHAWTFDEAYSAFAVQGLDKNGDGKLSPDELKELAQVNVESLHEFDFFTVAKAAGAKMDFAQPVDYALSYDKAQLTLTFTLPLRAPAPARMFTLEIFDSSWFVSFALAEGDDAVRMRGAPSGCARTVTRPRTPEPAQQQRLSEDFFSSMAGANFGASFVNRILVACP